MKLMHIIDWCSTLLFPKSRTYHIIEEADTAAISILYSPLSQGGVTWLTSYQQSLIQACVVGAKFEHNTKALTLLGVLLHTYLKEDTRTTIIIPIPLHSKRQRERGYNQVTEVVERAIVGLPHCTLDTHHLLRRSATPPQTSLAKAERLKNIQGAFTWRHTPIDWNNVKRVIICDDVYTTGATLKAAKMVVDKQVPKGVMVECVAWGH
jgi:predicted amidophosphoribosyltransferase